MFDEVSAEWYFVLKIHSHFTVFLSFGNCANVHVLLLCSEFTSSCIAESHSAASCLPLMSWTVTGFSMCLGVSHLKTNSASVNMAKLARNMLKGIIGDEDGVGDGSLSLNFPDLLFSDD